MSDDDVARAPAAYNTRTVHGDGDPRAETPKRPVSIVRGTANTLTLIGGIAFALGWAMHWPPYILGRVLLFAATAFVVSFVSILIENRRHPEADDT